MGSQLIGEPQLCTLGGITGGMSTRICTIPLNGHSPEDVEVSASTGGVELRTVMHGHAVEKTLGVTATRMLIAALALAIDEHEALFELRVAEMENNPPARRR